jgi:ribosomal protein L11
MVRNAFAASARGTPCLISSLTWAGIRIAESTSSVLGAATAAFDPIIPTTKTIAAKTALRFFITTPPNGFLLIVSPSSKRRRPNPENNTAPRPVFAMG